MALSTHVDCLDVASGKSPLLRAYRRWFALGILLAICGLAIALLQYNLLWKRQQQVTTAFGHDSRANVGDPVGSVDCTPSPARSAQAAAWEALGIMLLAGLAATALLLGLIALHVDRTRLKSELRQSEHKVRAIFDQTYEFIGLLSPDGMVMEANRSALEFSGVSAASVLNKPFWETPWWTHSPELQEKLRQAIARAAAGEFVRMEVTHPSANGEVRWMDFSLKPVRDETGNVVFLIPEGRDIDDRKRAERALREEKRLLRELLDLHEHDRQLVAYEIHDGLAQQLTGALYKLDEIARLQQEDPAGAAARVDSAQSLLRAALAEARRLMSGLRPPVLEESGVVAAIEYLIGEQKRQDGPAIEFSHGVQFDRLAAPLEISIFRIVQECLTNACRYSQSKRIRVQLTQAGDWIHIQVQDWGVGFDPAEVHGEHFGLRGVHERARLLGGRVTVQSAPSQGTCISVELPTVTHVANGGAAEAPPPIRFA